MITRYFTGILLLLITLDAYSGCASLEPKAPPLEPRPLGGDLPSFEAPAAGAADRQREDAFGEPARKLSLRDALALALMRNPELEVFSWEVRAREAEALQAGLRPNPELAVELENFGGSGELEGFGGSEGTVALSQLIELGGKRGKRLDAARLERDVAAWEYEAKRIEVFTELAKAFVAVLAAQERITLGEELVRVAEGVLETVSRQVEAGAVSPVEESRALVALETSRVDLNQAYRALTAERKRLAAMWGSTDPLFSEAVGDLERVIPLPSLENLLGRIEGNPDVARRTTELEQRRAALALEKAIRIPDLSVGGGLRRLGEADDNAFVFELGLPIPFFDRNQGAIQAATYGYAQAEGQRRAEEVRVRTELATTYEELAATEAEVLALRDVILPEAAKAFATTRDAYRRGLMRFTDVLDTQRTLFELRGRYFSTLARYHSAVADIERLIGEPLSGLTEQKERQ